MEISRENLRKEDLNGKTSHQCHLFVLEATAWSLKPGWKNSVFFNGKTENPLLLLNEGISSV